MIDFKALVDNSIDVIVRGSLDGIWTYASPSIERLIGVAPEDFVGKPYGAFILPEDLPAVERINATHSAGRSEGFLTYRMVRKDGSTVWVEGTARLVFDAVTGISDLVIVLRDISDRKALETKLALLALTNAVPAPHAAPAADNRRDRKHGARTRTTGLSN